MTQKIEKLESALKNGLLSFPVTDMDTQGHINPTSYRNRLEWISSYPVSAVFVAGGTGEFFSLSRDEYRQIVQIASEVIRDRPVISSIGGSIPTAIEFAHVAEQHGIDALLLMPPYLVQGPAEGVINYATAIIHATSLPVIYYNRGHAILQASELERLAAACPNLIGLKDGTGNIQLLNDTIRTLGPRLVYIGGVPTAEILSEAYLSIGVSTYSSAVFNFLPELALKFYQALRTGDKTFVIKCIQTFFIPFVRLRSSREGYAVSLIKAGADIIGKGAGDVRAPLVMPTKADRDVLIQLIETSEKLL